MTWIFINLENRLVYERLFHDGPYPCHHQVIEKSAEYNKPVYMTFIDYEKSFDSVAIAAVMKALHHQGVEEDYMTLLDDIYKDSTGTIILHKQSEKFSLRKGVREGDTISPKLFTACLESVFRRLDWENLGVGVNGEHLGHMRFAYNIVLLSNSLEDLQGVIHDLHKESLVVGLKIDKKESKVVPNSLAGKQPFSISNEILEAVN